MKKRYSVDRIENGIAILVGDDGEIIKVDKSYLTNARETDIVFLKDGKYITDQKETAERKEKLFKKQNSIFKD